MLRVSENKLYLLIYLILLLIIYLVPILGTDFRVFYLAGKEFLHLQNPYTVYGFFSPPWIGLFVAPISVLPIYIARFVWLVVGASIYFISFKRLKFDNLSIVLLFLNPCLYVDLGIGNCDWLVLLGATLEPVWGAWLCAIKPQTSTGLFLLWIKQRNWKALIPAVVLCGLLIVGLYRFPDPDNLKWSADIWPWGIPFGLFLLYLALRKEDKLLALAAAPFLSPYMALQSWIFISLPMTRNKKILAIATLLGWLLIPLFMSGNL